MPILPSILDSIGIIRNKLFLYKNSDFYFPDFIGIGAQKSGTTWLYKNMLEHPEIFLPKIKEIHFFDWYFYKGIQWYSNIFSNIKQRKKGEITPGYSIISEKKIKLIQKINPKLKIILLLRNPVERAWSHAVMNLSTIPNKEINKITNNEFIKHFNSTSSIERGNYPKIINKWSKFFPKEQIFIANYNKIKEAPDHLLNDIFKFLEVEKITSFKDFPINEKILPIKRSKTKNTIPAELNKYLINYYKDDLNYLKNINQDLSWE